MRASAESLPVCFSDVVLVVVEKRFCVPADTLYEGMFAAGTVAAEADGAGGRAARFGLDEYLDVFFEVFADDLFKMFFFFVDFADVEEPRHRHVAVDVEMASVFRHTDVVDVDPVVAAIVVKDLNEVVEKCYVEFVHDACDRFADDACAGADDDDAEENGDERVEDDFSGHHDQDEADDDADRRVCIRLQMFSAGDERDRAVFSAAADGEVTCHVIHDGREGDEDDTVIQLCDLRRIKDVVDSLVDDDKACQRDHRSFGAGGEEFDFSVAVRVTYVARFHGNVKTEKSDEGADDVDRTFHGIGKNGDRLRDVPGREFDDEK